MTLLVVLGAWFATGVLATLVLGPRLRRAAEQAGVPLEPEPVYLADRSPLRWRLGTLAVVGLLAGSTGMAAAGALPGSAQSIAHHVLGSVGVHVPEATDVPTKVATGPAPTPWSDMGPSTSSPGPDTTAGASDPPAPPADQGPALDAPEGAGTGDDGTASTPSASGGSESPATTTPDLRPEGSDVPDAGAPVEEPSDLPADPPAEETPPTTTPPGEEPPPAEPPGDPGTTTTTSTTSTSTTLPAPPPPVDPAG
jgi:hypothetical protein